VTLYLISLGVKVMALSHIISCIRPPMSQYKTPVKPEGAHGPALNFAGSGLWTCRAVQVHSVVAITHSRSTITELSVDHEVVLGRGESRQLFQVIGRLMVEPNAVGAREDVQAPSPGKSCKYSRQRREYAISVIITSEDRQTS
jgi:hypothetical protein